MEEEGGSQVRGVAAASNWDSTGQNRNGRRARVLEGTFVGTTTLAHT